MTKQEIYIKKYDWHLVVFYNTRSANAEEILSYLLDHDYDPKFIEEIDNAGIINGYNSGLTITNNKDRSAVIVISKTTSCQEFFNTLIHELKHLIDFICLYDDLEVTGENSAYMIGEIGMLLFPVAGRFLCENN